MGRTIRYVMPHPDGWQLERRDGQRATRVTDKQEDVIEIGGRIREERTYGKDPEEFEG